MIPKSRQPTPQAFVNVYASLRSIRPVPIPPRRFVAEPVLVAVALLSLSLSNVVVVDIDMFVVEDKSHDMLSVCPFRPVPYYFRTNRFLTIFEALDYTDLRLVLHQIY